LVHNTNYEAHLDTIFLSLLYPSVKSKCFFSPPRLKHRGPMSCTLKGKPLFRIVLKGGEN